MNNTKKLFIREKIVDYFIRLNNLTSNRARIIGEKSILCQAHCNIVNRKFMKNELVERNVDLRDTRKLIYHLTDKGNKVKNELIIISKLLAD